MPAATATDELRDAMRELVNAALGVRGYALTARRVLGDAGGFEGARIAETHLDALDCAIAAAQFLLEGHPHEERPTDA